MEKHCLANKILEKAIVESLQPLLIYSKFVRKWKIDTQKRKRGIESYGQGQGEKKQVQKLLVKARDETECLTEKVLEKARVESMQPFLIDTKFVRK